MGFRIRRLAQVADRTAADDRAAAAGGAQLFPLRAVHRAVLRNLRARARQAEGSRDHHGRDDGAVGARHLHRHRRHLPDRAGADSGDGALRAVLRLLGDLADPDRRGADLAAAGGAAGTEEYREAGGCRSGADAVQPRVQEAARIDRQRHLRQARQGDGGDRGGVRSGGDHHRPADQDRQPGGGQQPALGRFGIQRSGAPDQRQFPGCEHTGNRARSQGPAKPGSRRPPGRDDHDDAAAAEHHGERRRAAARDAVVRGLFDGRQPPVLGRQPEVAAAGPDQ